jgi:solute:Na+ symporter, SSS family
LLFSADALFFYDPVINPSIKSEFLKKCKFLDIINVLLKLFLAVGILCGISAAALSTANSQIHALAEIYTIDIHKRYINSGESEKKLLSIGKKAVIAGAFIAYGLMLIISGSIIKMGALAFSGTAQIFIPVFGALAWNRSNSKAALVGILAGLSSDIMLWLLADFQIIYAGVLSLIINGTVFVILSIILPEEKATREKICGSHVPF